MAKLYEYQAKELLGKQGLPVPMAEVADSSEAAKKIAEKFGRPLVIKAQAWVTGRAQAGGVRFADDSGQAREVAGEILGMDLKGFKVTQVLMEERLDIEREFFLGLIIDDVAQAPVIVFSSVGGTGIEEIAREHPDKIAKCTVDIESGLTPHQARNLLVNLDIRGKLQNQITGFLVKFYKFCRKVEARSAEINPVVLTKQGEVLAADCHLVIDDYAVFRHPELGIEIAREFDRPPTALEKVSYQVEAGDHRGTFYFFQMERNPAPGEQYVGFHGAGGGGSMMSMDALFGQGFKLANFCDTSGNPSASKVYRAAKIILSQKNLMAYFASGSGVASQEQFHSARGLVKAFREFGLAVPAVIRIGGNSEELAMEILQEFTQDLPGEVEAYGRDTSAAACAKRLRELVDTWDYGKTPGQAFPRETAKKGGYSFETMTGAVFIDHERCRSCEAKPCLESCIHDVLKLQDGKPVLALSAEDARKGRCTECLACELACEFYGNKAIHIDLPIPGLAEAI